MKKVAKGLLEILKAEKLVLDWRSRQQSRAAVRQSIEIELDKLPQVYSPEIFEVIPARRPSDTTSPPQRSPGAHPRRYRT